MEKLEIKYRAIGIDKPEWIYGYVAFDSKKLNAVIIHKQANNEMQHTAVEPETVGQYTGLKDSKGVEIYEGDIISFTRPVGNWTGRTMTSISKIYFEQRICAFVMDSVGDYTKLRKHHFYIYEVLGNIYQK